MEPQNHDNWNPDFIRTSPLFFPLRETAGLLPYRRDRWPDLVDFQNFLAQLPDRPKSLNGKTICFASQGERATLWTEDYEPRIYLTGEVQTRLKNWHDFFQVLVWGVFPRTKAFLNAKHFQAIARRMTTTPDSKQRSPLENALTQFDECGAIIVSSDAHLLRLVAEFRWKELFWHHRADISNKLQCFVFGHAIYEKALTPYIGMTAHGILLTAADDFFQWPLSQQLKYLDHTTAAAFEENPVTGPRHFQPFPVLGMPGWDKNNDEESYYDNVNYFRPGRSKR